MPIITLYRYERDGGGITVSPVKPDKAYTLKYRLVADEGKVFVKGDDATTCLDVDSTDGWEEIEEPEEIKEEEQ